MLYQGFCRVRVSAIRRQTLFQNAFFLFCAVMLWCCFLPKHTTAQTRDTTTKEKTFVPIESMMQTSTSTSATRSTQATMTKSPVLALALSLIPGLGQMYVESYWKAPIFFGGFGTAVGFTVYNSSKYNEANTLYTNADADTTITAGAKDIFLRQREIYRDLRDVSIVAIVGVIGLAAIDAYVGAHLFDFDVSDEFKASLQLDPFRQRINLAIRWEAPRSTAPRNYELRITNDEWQSQKPDSKP